MSCDAWSVVLWLGGCGGGEGCCNHPGTDMWTQREEGEWTGHMVLQVVGCKWVTVEGGGGGSGEGGSGGNAGMKVSMCNGRSRTV